MYRYRRRRSLRRRFPVPDIFGNLYCKVTINKLNCVRCGSYNVHCECENDKHVHKCIDCVHEFRLRER